MSDNENDILASVVMPMLNEARFIGPCLDSVLTQTFDVSRVEILVVDGGSTDCSREIVREYAVRHPQIRLLENPYRYQAQALNIAIPQTRGKYVLRMDCHSTYVRDYIEQVVSAFERTGADNVQGPNVTRPGADTTEASAIFFVQGSRLGGGTAYGRQEGGEGRFLRKKDATSGWSFTRRILDQVGPFDERLIRNQDNEYTSRLLGMGGRAWFEPKARAHYFARSSVAAFLRLMFRNGYYHMLTWRISPESFSMTHAAPAAFVLSLIVLGAAAAILGMPALGLLIGVLAIHAVAIAAESIRISAKDGLRFLLWLPWLFPVMHLVYGIGTLLGVLRFGFVPIDRSSRGRRVDTTGPDAVPSASGASPGTGG
ncbi:MAG: glycosyltransferase family 2 protein [Phycisphaerae bacterium]